MIVCDRPAPPARSAAIGAGRGLPIHGRNPSLDALLRKRGLAD
jgi:hypothetical protein